MNGFLANRLFENQTTPDGGGGAAPPEQKPAEPERPEWLLPKFQNPEEQGRAYAEAEKRMAQLQTQLDQERQQFAETLQSVQQSIPATPEPTYNPDQDPIILQYEKAVNDGDARAQLSIQLELQKRQIEQIIEKQNKPIVEQMNHVSQSERENAITLATERVKVKYGEQWEELAPKIGQLLQERPHWIPQGASVEAFATTLDEVAGLVLSQEARVQQEKDEADRVAKLSAQGLSGSGSRQLSPEEQTQQWQQIKDVQLGGYSGIIRG